VNYLLIFGVAVFSSASGALMVACFDAIRRENITGLRSRELADKKDTPFKANSITD
jgi:hypothetical protein